VQLVYN